MQKSMFFLSLVANQVFSHMSQNSNATVTTPVEQLCPALHLTFQLTKYAEVKFSFVP